MSPRTAWDLDVSHKTYDALEANETREEMLRKKMELWNKQIAHEGGLDLYSCETADEKVTLLTRRISEIYAAYEQLQVMDAPYLERRLFVDLSDVHQLKALRKRYQWQTWKSDEYEEITNDMIQRARSVPLEELIEVPRTKMILCFFHKEKNPSMLVRNGFAYCFSCGAWCDSIKYLMHMRGLPFPNAVKTLINK